MIDIIYFTVGPQIRLTTSIIDWQYNNTHNNSKTQHPTLMSLWNSGSFPLSKISNMTVLIWLLGEKEGSSPDSNKAQNKAHA